MTDVLYAKLYFFMSRIKAYPFCIILVVFIFFAILYLSCIKNKKDLSLTRKMKELHLSYDEKNEMLQQEFYQITLNQIVNNQIIVNSFEKNRDEIFSLLPKNRNNIILYRYSEYMCNSCIQEDLNLLYEFQKENKSFKICVAVDYVDNRENHIRFNSELEKFKHLRLDRTLLSLPINNTLETECRYFAVIVNDKISYVFFPIRGSVKLTKMYFDLIEKLN